PAQWKTPLRFSVLSGLEPDGSVSSWRNTANCAGVRCARHCASVFSTSKDPAMACDGLPMRQSTVAPDANATMAALLNRKLRRFMAVTPLDAESMPACLSLANQLPLMRRQNAAQAICGMPLSIEPFAP